MQDYSHAVISSHCLEQLQERQLPVNELKSVLRASDNILASGPGRVILHKLVEEGGKFYLWRVVVDVDAIPPRVITVYKTSKLKKYLTEH